MNSWLSRFMSKNMDLDDSKINTVTSKDVGVLLLLSPILYILTLPLLLLFVVFELFEMIVGLFVVVSIFASPVSLALIFGGQATPIAIVVAVVSTSILLLRYLVFPIVTRTKRYQGFKKRLLRV